MARSPKLFSLDVDTIAALERLSKESGEPMSRIVERGIRVALTLPPVAPEEKEESKLEATRTERAVLEVLKKRGPGPHLTTTIAGDLAGDRASSTVYEKALHALALRGEVHLWGAGQRWSDQCGWTLAWDLQSPIGRVSELLAMWKAHPQRDRIRGMTIDAIENLAVMIDDLAPVLALVDQEMGPNSTRVMHEGVEVFRMENLRQREARRDAEYRAKYPNGHL